MNVMEDLGVIFLFLATWFVIAMSSSTKPPDVSYVIIMVILGVVGGVCLILGSEPKEK